jgi:acetolactate synthase I/II/III large subunit
MAKALKVMKLSDFVAHFLAQQSIRHVFAISGGASLHLIHSVADNPQLDLICPHHEQAAAMAADAYSRLSGNIGAAIATSGPGATNLITGICCAFYDSVPVLFITGQVSTFRMRGDTGVRQLGFQETDIVNVVRPITKYAALVHDPKDIRHELEKAVWIARHGRPGPVLVDIPDNLQRENIDVASLRGFTPELTPAEPERELADDVRQVVSLLATAERPVLVLGWGVRLAKCLEDALDLVRRAGIPTLLTWGALDYMPHSEPLLIGSFGTHGTRYGNFALQNSDLVIAIGSRMDTHSVGSPFSSFARAAKKVMVDIDAAEIGKFSRENLRIDVPIAADAASVIREMLAALSNTKLPEWREWKRTITDWKKSFPVVAEAYRQGKTVNPYVFVEALADAAREDETIVVDSGCGVAWLGQAFVFKAKQRYIHAFNNTPMGYALPGAIGASLATGRRVLCVAGDGGLHVNIHELATVVRHRLPVKIFVLNNRGYSMIQQTQDQWLGSRYFASSLQGGLGFPDFVALAKAYGMNSFAIRSNDDITDGIQRALADDEPILVDLEIPSSERVIPQVKFGRPIEDCEPLLPRRDFLKAMIVDPLPVCLKD